MQSQARARRLRADIGLDAALWTLVSARFMATSLPSPRGRAGDGSARRSQIGKCLENA